MDILDEILSASPSTWRKVANSSYDDGYYCEQLSSDSVEYQLVSEAFRPNCTVKYIKRVQNPYQLALFKISREKAQAEGHYLHEVQGYHVIYETDLDTALKYTVDYRRYENYELSFKQQDFTNKQPMFYRRIIDAVNAFNMNLHNGRNKLVLICDVLSEQLDPIKTSTQADYHINYVICIE